MRPQWPATVRETRKPEYDYTPVQLQLFADVQPLGKGWYAKAARAMRKSQQEPSTLKRSLQCPEPMRLSADQLRCAYCGIVWDIDEERPPCDGPDHHP